MSRDHASDRQDGQASTTDGRRLVLAIDQATFTISMVVTMLAASALSIFLGYVFGIETTEIGSFPGYFLVLGGLLAFIAVWNAAVTLVQSWLIKRYSGLGPTHGIRRPWLPPYWRRHGHGDKGLHPSLYSHAPGARLERAQLIKVVCVAPVMAVVSIIGALVSMYTLRVDYALLIGVTAGLGGPIAFFVWVPRLLRLEPSTRFEMVSDPSTLLIHRDC